MKEIPVLLTKNLEILARSQPKLTTRLREHIEILFSIPFLSLLERKGVKFFFQSAEIYTREE